MKSINIVNYLIKSLIAINCLWAGTGDLFVKAIQGLKARESQGIDLLQALNQLKCDFWGQHDRLQCSIQKQPDQKELARITFDEARTEHVSKTAALHAAKILYASRKLPYKELLRAKRNLEQAAFALEAAVTERNEISSELAQPLARLAQYSDYLMQIEDAISRIGNTVNQITEARKRTSYMEIALLEQQLIEMKRRRLN